MCRYYPRLVYRKLAKLADDFIPLFESALYIHNFKGANSGALFRVYPGPWQVGIRVQRPCVLLLFVMASTAVTAQGDRASRAQLPHAWHFISQVLKRTRDGLQTVHTQDTMPSLKEVALNILPNA